MYPAELNYLETHQWVELNKDVATTGITMYPIEQDGDITGIDLPNVGDEVEQMTEVGSIEFGKEILALHAPVSGQLIEVNQNVINNFGVINEYPYDNGWLFKIKINDEAEMQELLTAKEYKNFVTTIDVQDEIDTMEV